MLIDFIIYFRENQLSDVKELNKLACLKSLKTLVVSDNSFSVNSIRPTIRSKVLKLLPWLERVDKGTVSPAECESERSDEKSHGNEENEDEEDD